MISSAHISIELLLSQQLCLLITEFSQLIGLLITLMVKQGFFLSLSDKLILNEPAYSGMLSVSVERIHHGANCDIAYGRTHAFYRTPFHVTQII